MSVPPRRITDQNVVPLCSRKTPWSTPTATPAAYLAIASPHASRARPESHQAVPTSPFRPKTRPHLNKLRKSSNRFFAASALLILSRPMLKSANTRFFRCSSSIFSSNDFSMMNRVITTSRFWPNRCTRSTACASAAGLNCGSMT